jgi:alpha-ketoglutarate-dependent taurine dioxygenase
MRATAWAVAWAMAAAVAAGCGSGGGPAGGGGKGGGAGTPAPEGVVLKDATVADLENFLKENKTFVVLYEFWSVGDPDAAKRIADADTYYLTNKGYGLRSVSVCVDGPGKRAEAEKVLQEQKVMFPNFLLADKAAAGLAEKYGFTGQTPHRAVFARSGDRVWKTGDPLPENTGPKGKVETSELRKFQGMIFIELDKTK